MDKQIPPLEKYIRTFYLIDNIQRWSPIQESSKRCVYSISSAGSINIDDICYMNNQTIHLETKFY